jgi:hypothetical protein
MLAVSPTAVRPGARILLCVLGLSSTALADPLSAPLSDPVAPTPAAGAEGAPEPPCPRFSFLGQTTLATGLRFEDTEVGGLSGLVYDPDREVFFALSDDRGTEAARGPARIYTLEIVLEGQPPSIRVRVLGVTALRDRNGEPFEPGSLDPEGLALTPSGTFLVSSEGDASRGVAPFVREFARDGSMLRSFSVPAAYLPADSVGVRSNLGFEALATTPDFSTVFVGTENALVQDGPKADLRRGSPSRILRYDPASGRPVAEYLYLTEPVAAPPLPPSGFSAAGLVELLALDADRLLALERSYSDGVGVTARLFAVSLGDATEITGRRSVDPESVRPAAKRLLVDLTDLGVPLDNLEALAWGPDLPDGRRTLLILSDNNFNPLQVTQLLAFAEEPGETHPKHPAADEARPSCR